MNPIDIDLVCRFTGEDGVKHFENCAEIDEYFTRYNFIQMFGECLAPDEEIESARSEARLWWHQERIDFLLDSDDPKALVVEMTNDPCAEIDEHGVWANGHWIVGDDLERLVQKVKAR